MRGIVATLLVLLSISACLAACDDSKAECLACGGSNKWFTYSPVMSKTPYSTPSGPYDIAAGDLDNDGDLDVVVLNNGAGSFTVFFNNGAGSFTQGGSFSTGINPIEIALGKFNSDSYLDVAVIDSYDILRTFNNNGAGSFTQSNVYSGINSPSDIAVGDLNGDTYSDIVTNSLGYNTLIVYLNSGSGSFTSTSHTLTNSLEDIALSDFNYDGDLDILITDIYASYFKIYNNNGLGSFTAGLSYSFTDGWPLLVAAGKLNSDNYPDVVIGYGGGIGVYLNTGSGNYYTTYTLYTSFGADITDFTLGDMDGDGDLDVMALFYNSRDCYFFKNNGNGLFTVENSFSTGSSPMSIANGDFDNDKLLDVVTTDGGQFAFYKNIGLQGTNSPCCGDDGTSDNFYNSSLYCYQGNPTTNGDLLNGFCDLKGNKWFTNVLGGTNSPCCGDDYTEDVFYNSTLSCLDGFVTTDRDQYKNYCTVRQFNWFEGLSYNYYESFTTTPSGSLPTNWLNQSMSGGYTYVIDSYQGQSKVLSLNNTSGHYAKVNVHLTQPIERGLMSFKLNLKGADIGGNYAYVTLLNSSGSILWQFYSGFSEFYMDYAPGYSLSNPYFTPVLRDHWYNVNFFVQYDKLDVYFDDTLVFDDVPIYSSSFGPVSNITFETVYSPNSPFFIDDLLINASIKNFASCCGDDGLNDIFYNNSLMCSQGGLLNDVDSLAIEDKPVNFLNHASGKNMCLLKGYDWFSINYNFAAPVIYYTAGSGSSSDVKMGDLDGDGDLDAVTVDSAANQISVLLNNGNGTFATAVPYSTGTNPSVVAIGDLDGDTNLDLAVSNGGSNQLSVLLNNGAGIFASAVPYATGTNPKGVALGDLDSDGDLDAVTADLLSNQLSVLLNNGDGTFASAVPYGTGTNPFDVAIGDLDSDGDLDIVNVDAGSNQMNVFKNNGAGTFATRVPYSTGTYPESIVLGDLDGDGDLDVATEDGTTQFSILLNNGAGIFASAVPYTTTDIQGIVLGDFDNDGDLDITIGIRQSSQFSIFTNNGAGTFAFGNSYAVYDWVQDISAGDFDNDGDLDVLTAVTGSPLIKSFKNLGINGTNGPCCGDDGALDNFYNRTIGITTYFCQYGSFINQEIDSNQTICSFYNYSWLSGTPSNLTVGSCCGDDGLSDNFYNGTIGNTTNFCYLGQYIHKPIDINNNTCTYYGYNWFYTSDRNLTFNNEFPLVDGYMADLGDIDGDGYLDLAVSNNGYETTIYHNNGNNTFTLTQTLVYGDEFTQFWDILLRDFDGDSDLDVIMSTINTGVSENITVFSNDGSGYFSLLTSELLDCTNLDASDINNDNLIDVVCSNTICLNSGGTSLDCSIVPGYLAYSGYLPKFININNDGYNDLVISNKYDSAYTYINNGLGSFLTGSLLDTGNFNSIAVGDLDNDNDDDMILEKFIDSSTSIVLIKINNGGTFSTYQTITGFDWSWGALDLLDFNGDDYLDLIVTEMDDQFIKLFLNNGSGYFTERQFISGFYPGNSMTGDINNDGKKDFLVINENTNAMRIYLNEYDACCGDDGVLDNFNNGTDFCVNGEVFFEADLSPAICSFSGGTWFTDTIAGTNGPCCGDDGASDIFYNNSLMCSEGGLITDADFNARYDYLHDKINFTSGKPICQLKSYNWKNGNTEYNTYSKWTASAVPQGFTTGDFNNDGNLDVIVAVQTGNSLLYYGGLGNGSFNDSISIASLSYPFDVKTADFDSDGNLDFLVMWNTNIGIALGNGDGTFSSITTISSKSGDGIPNLGNPMDVADYNKDGFLDFIAYNLDSYSTKFFPGNGDGTFGSPITVTGLAAIVNLATGDFNNDNNLDVMGFYGGYSSGVISVMLGNGNGIFDENVVSNGVNRIYSCDVFDFDSDGNLDAACSEHENDLVSFWTGLGNGSFIRTSTKTGIYGPWSLEFGDYNSDGFIDLAVGAMGHYPSEAYSVGLFLGNGAGLFSDVVSVSTSLRPNFIKSADFNNDNILDIGIIHNLINPNFDVLINTGFNGTNGPCCGDDSTLDNFYNGTISTTNYFCHFGSYVGQSIDANKTICEYYLHDWFSGGVSGSGSSYASCCGDDGTNDLFYGLNKACNMSEVIDDPDLWDNFCKERNYKWFTGLINGTNGPCCGDDSKPTRIIGAGQAQVCAVLANGSVSCWGCGGAFAAGQCSVPAGLSDVTEVTAGTFHTCALKKDGTVSCWGCEGYNYGQCSVPFGLNNVIDIDGSYWGTCALKSDSSIACWGANVHGAFSVPPGLNGVVNIYTEDLHSCALLDNGNVTCWGCLGYDYGNCAPYTGGDAIALETGSRHNCILKADGNVFCWGSNEFGERDIPAGLNNAVSISAGGWHTCALLNTGNVTCWGHNGYPETVSYDLGDANYIEVGEFFSCVIKNDNSVYCWGCGGVTEYGQCVIPPNLDVSLLNRHGADDFYNGTISTTNNFCYNGSYVNQDIDTNKNICEHYYPSRWFSGATTSEKCCGDDGSLDDFGNNTNVCCCNGVVVPSGTYCDLGEDGNFDSQCINGNLPNIFISQSTFTNAYVTEEYNPNFLLRNTGNETICVTSALITNTTLTYTPSSNNPTCITPGNSGLYSFNFGAFTCEEMDKEFYPVMNITYNSTSGKTESIIKNLHVIVKSPIDITSVTPSVSNPLAIPLNEFDTIIVTLKNEAETSMDYNATVTTDAGLMLLFNTQGITYTSEQLITKSFTMQPKSTAVYSIKTIPTSEGIKTAQVTFNSMNGCANATDFISFQISGFKKTTEGGFVASAWDNITVILLLLCASLVIYKRRD